jgi:hypothetical protein
LLCGLSFFAALLVGYGTSVNDERSWMHILMFSTILSVTVYLIVDMELPRQGLIRVDSFDQILREMGKKME